MKILRLPAITILFSVSVILLACESESMEGILSTKLFGMAALCLAWRLFGKWEGSLPKLNISCSDDGEQP